MTMHKTLHPRNDSARMYMSRKEGRGLISIEECVYSSIRGFEDYIEKSEQRLIKAANNNNGNIITQGKASKTSQ